jgi:hypothetical protein
VAANLRFSLFRSTGRWYGNGVPGRPDIQLSSLQHIQYHTRVEMCHIFHVFALSNCMFDLPQIRTQSSHSIGKALVIVARHLFPLMVQRPS